MIFPRTRARLMAPILLCVAVMGCTSMQVDTDSADRFAGKGYASFSWRTEIPTGVPTSMESLYQLSTTVRDVVAAELEKKGYQYQTAGGDFVVSYAFGARLEGGVEPEPNFGPTSSVINRSPDPAVMDNAYALSGPREVASLMLSFEDGGNLAPVRSARISQVVENQNQPDLDKVRRKLEPGVARALRVLPNAVSR